MDNIPWEVEFDAGGAQRSCYSVWLRLLLRDPWAPGGYRSSAPLLATELADARWPAERKAGRMAARLRMAYGAALEVGYRPGDSHLTLQVRERPEGEWAGALAIDHVGQEDRNTGEGITSIKEAPGRPSLASTGYLYLAGRGEHPEGVVQLRVGRGREAVEVATYGKSAERLVQDLVRGFNARYQGSGWVAQAGSPLPPVHLADAPCMQLMGLPCSLGLGAGTRDPGLSLETGLVRFEQRQAA